MSTPIKIGPILTVHEEGYIPNMHDAYETDFEMGNHHLANAKAEEFNKQFPTVGAMAALIEKERDMLRDDIRRISDELCCETLSFDEIIKAIKELNANPH